MINPSPSLIGVRVSVIIRTRASGDVVHRFVGGWLSVPTSDDCGVIDWDEYTCEARMVSVVDDETHKTSWKEIPVRDMVLVGEDEFHSA